MKTKYKRILVAGVVIIAAAAAVFYLLKPMQAAGVRLQAEDYRQVIEEEGNLFAGQQWNLYAPDNLIVEKIFVQEGDPVEAGQQLVQLDGSLLEKQAAANKNALTIQILNLKGELSSASSQKALYTDEMINRTIAGIDSKLQTADANHKIAVKAHESAAQLYAEGFLPKADLDLAELEVLSRAGEIQELSDQKNLTRIQMQASKTHYETVELALKEQIAALESFAETGNSDMQSAQISYLAERALVKAFDAGTVLAVHVREGEMADVVTPVISIYREGDVRAEVYLLAEDAESIHPGMSAEIILKGQQKERISATVISVSSFAEQKTSALGLTEHRVKVILMVEGSRQLIIGQNVDVEFVLESREQAVAVPKAAVFPYEDGFGVMIVAGGRAELREITKDFETDTMVVIEAGVAEDDIILLNPTADGLKEGIRVEVIE